ncbi:hypothetical protein GCK72_003881 [Caenorhabditis remanei]|uniref:F-box domain-containing protein n=1 Tax=Caenorhabditis remanei TaxID=31234 RepID=A0A6A5H9R9_CAERE|nr:hypothetical protein GCK72_003881 [Caenorhabditis remanei]KAF1763935.1 hypothetical protein GCK72_003881 [Caenorhabditis remanei]
MLYFPFLKLPFLPIQNIVHNLSCTEIIELSLCSRRSKRLMQSIRHPEPTHIEIIIDQYRMYVALRNGIKQCLFWSIRTESHIKYNRVDTIENVRVRVLKLTGPNFMIDGTHEPETVLKALVDHLKDVFKVPLEVNFKPYKMENFFRFLPVFPVCKQHVAPNRVPNFDENDNKLKSSSEITPPPTKKMKTEEAPPPTQPPLIKMLISFKRERQGFRIKKVETTIYNEVVNGQWKPLLQTWKSSIGIYSEPKYPIRPPKRAISEDDGKPKIPKLKLIKNADNNYSKVS